MRGMDAGPSRHQATEKVPSSGGNERREATGKQKLGLHPHGPRPLRPKPEPEPAGLGRGQGMCLSDTLPGSLICWSRDRPHLESRCSSSFWLYSLPLGALALNSQAASSPPAPPPPPEWPQGVISTAQKGKHNLDWLHSATYPPRRMTTRAGLCPLARIVFSQPPWQPSVDTGKIFTFGQNTEP